MEASENINPIEILLVEDNPNDAELTLRALKKHNLVNKVFVVRDGEEALDFIFYKGKFEDRKKSLPKVILLDLKLPKVDGIEVLKEIKSHKHTQQIPIVVLTTSKSQNDIIETYKLGVNSYIVKPVDFNKFIESVADIGFYWLMLNEIPNQ
ncbi:response regulator [Bacteroidota bacterium]